jgi:hypothetical protein
MQKVNIANYTINDLANRFNCAEHTDFNSDIVSVVAENWHKKHFVSSDKSIKQHHKTSSTTSFLI